MLFQLEHAEERGAKPLLASRPSPRARAPAGRAAWTPGRGPLAGIPRNAVLGASLLPGTRGGTCPPRAPLPPARRGAGHSPQLLPYPGQGCLPPRVSRWGRRRERNSKPEAARGNICPTISPLTHVIHFKQNFKTAPQRRRLPRLPWRMQTHSA